MNRAQDLIDGLLSLPEEATSPNPIEPRADMLSQLSALRLDMDSQKGREFDDYVHWAANQRYLANGTTDEVLQKMHPHELQLVVQKYNLQAQTPDGTPGA